MIIEFSVTNFGSIKDKQTISFEASSSDELEDYYIVEPIPGLRLLKLGIIYGPNASGKTTILNALNFLRQLVERPLSQKSDVFNYQPFLLDINSIKLSTEFQISFVLKQIKYSYNVELTKTHIISERLVYFPKGRPADIYNRTTDAERQLSSISVNRKVKITSRDLKVIEANTIWNNTVLGAISKINVDAPELKKITNWFLQILSPVLNSATPMYEGTLMQIQNRPELKTKIAELITKADVQIGAINVVIKEEIVNQRLHDLISRISPGEEDPLAKFLIDGKFAHSEVEFLHSVKLNGEEHTKSLPHELESKGTLQYFALSGPLYTSIENERIVVIDEIESSLHPDLMKQIILIFLANSSASQLICTTHNVSFLDEKDVLRNDSVWFTQKRDNGSTELYSLDDFDSSIFRRGSSVINAYRIGKLGAKPNLGNVFLTETDTNG